MISISNGKRNKEKKGQKNNKIVAYFDSKYLIIFFI